MSIAEATTPFLVGTAPPPEKPRSMFQMLFQRQSNEFESIPRPAFEKPVWEWKNVFGHTFMVSDPAGVKRVLLDNVANYPKTEMETKSARRDRGRRPAGLPGRQVEVAPPADGGSSFDFKSIVAYSPAMVASAESFADAWSTKGRGAVIDVAEEMTRLTLEVISRTMFSSDGEELGGLVDDSLRKMGEALDFGIADVLPLIGPPRMKRKMARIHANFLTMDATMQKLIAAREKVQGDAPPRPSSTG